MTGNGKLSPERSNLAGDYFLFAMKIASKYKLYFKNYKNEIESAAMLGLCQAAMNYDNSFNIEFSTFALRRITGGIQDCLRIKGKYEKRFLTNELDPDSDSMAISHHISINDKEDIDNALRVLNGKEKQMVKMYFMENLGISEIGQKFNLSPSRISKIVIDSMKMVRENIKCA